MARQLHNYRFEVKNGLKGNTTPYNLPLEGVSNILGQAAAIRFFNEKSKADFEALNEILTHKQIRNWMDDTGKLTWSDYRYWAGNHTDSSFLFSVHDARKENSEDAQLIRGFINIYSERSEKFRVKRMAKFGIFKSVNDKHFLEFSMALRPFKKEVSGSGLMSSGLRQACLQVKSLLTKKDSELVIFGFIDPKNQASVRAITAAGFTKKGKAKYDADSESESDVYVLNWQKLRRLISKKKDEALKTKMKIILEPQITDSHCGPAVIKAILGYYKINISQTEVVNAARIKSSVIKHGMTPKDIAQAINKLSDGLKFWYRQNTNSKIIELLINQYKLPVAVNWQGLFYNSPEIEKKQNLKSADYGHYSIVLEINKKKDTITIDDPYPEYFHLPRTFSFRWFKTRWWDQDVKINFATKKKKIINTKKLIFTVTPADFIFPANLGMKEYKDLAELEVID